MKCFQLITILLLLYVCPDASVLTNGVKHGAEHIFLANFQYTEDFHATGRDGYTYYNCSENHTTGIVHPLLPRAGRCGGGASQVEKQSLITGQQIEETPIPEDILVLAAGFGIELNERDRMATGVIIRPIK